MQPAELHAIINELLSERAEGEEISLDRIGEALGTMAVTVDEIEVIVSALESAGRSVAGGVEGDPKEDLRVVVQAVHALRVRGKTPTVAQLSSATGLSEARVRTALRLGQVIGR